jgi:hypothetical protein
LFGESALDQTFETIFRLVRAKSSGELIEFAKRLGRAPIRLVYAWARDHVRHGLGADIDWRRGERVLASLFMQQDELRQLQEIIAHTSEDATEHLTVTGTLVGADSKRRTFHLVTTSEQDIRGTFANAISSEKRAELPKRYRASLIKTTRVQYSTDEEAVSYFLESLSDAGPELEPELSVELDVQNLRLVVRPSSGTEENAESPDASQDIDAKQSDRRTTE